MTTSAASILVVVDVPENCDLLVRRLKRLGISDIDGSLEGLTHLAGPPLGLRRNVEYKSAAVDFNSGDAVLVVTDGFTEAFDAQGHFFGAERIERYLAATDPRQPGVLDTLRDEVRAFEAGRPPSDDMAAVLLWSEGA